MMNTKGLAAIFKENNCDKFEHQYYRLYTLLSMFREPNRILEIGIMDGASLLSWLDFFTDTHITGVEIHEGRCETAPKDERIEIVCGDIKEVAISGKFDWIIDDGSHKGIDVLTGFSKLWDNLSVGGWYIIEDLHCAFWDDYKHDGEFWIGSINKLVNDWLHQSGSESTFSEFNPPKFGMVFQDKSIIAIQKR